MKVIIPILLFTASIFAACKTTSTSENKTIERSETGWTLVRRVEGSDSLTQAMGPGAKVNGHYISKSGSGVVVYGPYQREYGIKRFDLDAQVKMKITWDGHRKNTCYRHSGTAAQCIGGCPRRAYACDHGAGKVIVDVVMNDPSRGFGQFPIGRREIVIGPGSAENGKDVVYAVDDFMIMNDKDLDYLEFRVAIENDWMKVDVEEMRLTAKIDYK